MKKEFFGFYEASENEISDAWSNGIFAFDANTLLNLYRYSENTRNDFLTAIRKLSEKLFLPYQAAHEFHSNRLTVINNQDEAYEKIEKLVKENFDSTLKNQINQYKKHPSILIDNIFKVHEDFQKNLKKN